MRRRGRRPVPRSTPRAAPARPRRSGATGRPGGAAAPVPRCTPPTRPPRGASTSATPEGRRLGVDSGLARRMARGHRGPHDVGEGAGPAVGDLARQRGDLGGEHGIGAHHLGDALEPPDVLGGGHPLDDPAVDERAREPHADPDTRHRGRGERLRHEVVERPVEVGQRDVDHDPGDRVDRCRWRYGFTFAVRTLLATRASCSCSGEAVTGEFYPIARRPAASSAARSVEDVRSPPLAGRGAGMVEDPVVAHADALHDRLGRQVGRHGERDDLGEARAARTRSAATPRRPRWRCRGPTTPGRAASRPRRTAPPSGTADRTTA